VQATINKVMLRFTIFATGSVLLIVMAVRELVRVFGA